MTENAQNLKALEARLNSLRSELDAQIVGVQKRTRMLIVAFGILFIAMCFYLTFAFNKIAGFDAPMVMALVEAKALDKVDEALNAQIYDLKSAAPKHLKAVEDQILMAPHQMSAELQGIVVDKLAEHLPRLESELNDKIGAAIILAKTKAQEQKLDLSKPEDFKKFLDMATESVFGEMTKVVDRVHGEYSNIAGKAADYLDHIAGGEKLEKREQLHRGLFISFLMLHQKGPDPKDPAQGVQLLVEPK